MNGLAIKYEYVRGGNPMNNPEVKLAIEQFK
ncbi:unnamed protein product, partial [marine sediment metagenome]